MCPAERGAAGAWHPLANRGLNWDVRALAAHNGDNLYVGNLFTETADGAVQNLGSLAVLAVPPLPDYLVYLPLAQR